MKNFLLAISLSLAIGATFTLNSCKKETTEDDSVSAQDAAIVNGAMGQSADDAAAVAGQTGSTKSLHLLPCGISAIDSVSRVNDKTIIITYDGISWCTGHKRTGTVTVQLTSGAHWADVGAVLTVTYNLQVTDFITGGVYSLTGSHTITNESGGYAWQVVAGLLPNTSKSHRIQSSGMTLTFPNGTTRTWTFDITRTWTSSNGISTITLTTTTESAGVGQTTGIAVNGINRYGKSFTDAILAPVEMNNTCLYLPYNGTVQHVVNNRTTTIQYGLSACGGTQATGAPGSCGAGFCISYHNSANGNSLTRFVTY